MSIEVLGFVARRLYADRVRMVFAVREAEERAVVLAGLPELMVGGLAEEAAQELLARSAGAQVDQQVGGASQPTRRVTRWRWSSWPRS